MKQDIVIEQIRETRDRIAKACDYDAKRLVAYYLKRQREKKSEEFFSENREMTEKAQVK